MKKILPKSAKNLSGFTLVELLVVISIIAVLSVIGLTVFGGIQKNARDVRRKADIDAISKAWEINYGKCPGVTDPYCRLLPGFFSSGNIPRDPENNTTPYSYAGADETRSDKTYRVCADLEEDGRGTADTTAGSGANTNDYCKFNQQ